MFCLKLVRTDGNTEIVTGVTNVRFGDGEDGPYIKYEAAPSVPLAFPTELVILSQNECKEIYLLNSDGRTVEVIKKPS